MIGAIGWIGGFCLAICSLPQVIDCYRRKNADGLSWLFLMLWIVGEVTTLVYIILADLDTWQLLFNYTLNLIGLSLILYYKLFPKRKGGV